MKEIQKRLNTADAYISMALGLAVVLVIGTLVYNYTSRKQTAAPSPQTTETAISTPSATLSFPSQYQVQSGDTLWSIAEKYYQSGYNWVDLQSTNHLADPNMITAGQSLIIPDVKPTAVPAGQISAATTDVSGTKYTVVKGDYLWKISLDKYSNGYKWVDIARVNKLANPNLIHPGNVLDLP